MGGGCREFCPIWMHSATSLGKHRACCFVGRGRAVSFVLDRACSTRRPGVCGREAHSEGVADCIHNTRKVNQVRTSFGLPICRLSGYLDLIWMGTTLTDEPRMVRIAEYFVVGLLGSERLESIQAISWRTRGSSMSERFDSVEL